VDVPDRPLSDRAGLQIRQDDDSRSVQVRADAQDPRLAPSEPRPEGLRLLRAALHGRESPPRRDGAGHGVHRQEDRGRHEERPRHGGQPQPECRAAQVHDKPLDNGGENADVVQFTEK